MIVRAASEAITVSEFFALQEDALKVGLSLSIKEPEREYDMLNGEYLSEEEGRKAMEAATGGFILSGFRGGPRTFFGLHEARLFLDGYMVGSSSA